MTELFLHILMKCVEDSRVIHYRPHAVSAFFIRSQLEMIHVMPLSIM